MKLLNRFCHDEDKKNYYILGKEYMFLVLQCVNKRLTVCCYMC